MPLQRKELDLKIFFDFEIAHVTILNDLKFVWNVSSSLISPRNRQADVMERSRRRRI